jgi:fatty acid desaturase
MEGSTESASARGGPATEMPVRRRSDVRSALAAGAHFAVVFAPVYLTAWSGPVWLTVGCWLWFGVLSHGFHQLLHECAHLLTFREPRRNELLARWLLAPLYFADFDAFRRRHWRHHRELGQPGDPKYTYRIDIAGRRFVGLLVSMLTLSGAARKAFLQVGGRSEATGESIRRSLIAFAVVQAVFAATVVAAARLGHPGDWNATLLAAAVAYGFVYAYGVMSLTVWVTTLRAITEHRRTGSDANVCGEAALRNFSPGALDRLIFGAYGFTDHATHHRHPAVPSYLLPELTRRLAPFDPSLVPVGTRMGVIKQLVRGVSVPPLK